MEHVSNEEVLRNMLTKRALKIRGKKTVEMHLLLVSYVMLRRLIFWRPPVFRHCCISRLLLLWWSQCRNCLKLREFLLRSHVVLLLCSSSYWWVPLIPPAMLIFCVCFSISHFEYSSLTNSLSLWCTFLKFIIFKCFFLWYYTVCWWASLLSC